MVRAVLAGLLGNGLGYGLWRVTWWLLPGLWAGGETGLAARVGALVLTAVLIAGPPVLIGALSAALARRARLGIGLASGVWSIALIRVLPDPVPYLGPIWFAPTILILLSGALGGWMIELRAQVAEQIKQKT